MATLRYVSMFTLTRERYRNEYISNIINSLPIHEIPSFFAFQLVAVITIYECVISTQSVVSRFVVDYP